MSFRKLNVDRRLNETYTSQTYHPLEPLIILTKGDNIFIYNSNDYSLLRNISIKQIISNKVLWTSKYNYIVVCSENSIKAYDYQSGVCVSNERLPHSEIGYTYACTDIDFDTGNIVVGVSKYFFLYSISNTGELKLIKEFSTNNSSYPAYLKFSIKDPQYFAACVDSRIVFWNINDTHGSRFSLSHTRRIEKIEFHPDKNSTLIAGHDGSSIIVWDYQTQHITRKLDESQLNDFCFHPRHPILFFTRTSTLQTVSVVNTESFNIEGRDILSLPGKTSLISATIDKMCFSAEGVLFCSFPHDILVTSFKDKLFWVDDRNVCRGQIKVENEGEIDVQKKILEYLDSYPSQIECSKLGKLISVIAETNCSVYSALVFRSKASFHTSEFLWGDNDGFAYLSDNHVCIFESISSTDNCLRVNTGMNVKRLFNGKFIGVYGDSCIKFISWKTGDIVLQIDTVVSDVWWSDDGYNLALCTSLELYYFEIAHDYTKADNISEKDLIRTCSPIENTGILSGKFVTHNDINVFIYNDQSSLYFIVHSYHAPLAKIRPNNKIVTTANNFIILTNISYKFYAHTIPFDIIDIIWDILRESNSPLPPIPDQWRQNIVDLLQQKARYRDVIEISDNNNIKFENAMKLNDINLALKYAKRHHDILQIINLAMSNGDVNLLEKGIELLDDDQYKLLYYSVSGNKTELLKLIDKSEEKKNLSFAAAFATGSYSKCVDILMASGQYPEAALMARTYAPEKMDQAARAWKNRLFDIGDSTGANEILLPSENPDSFKVDPKIFQSVPEPEEKKLPEIAPKPMVINESVEGNTSSIEPVSNNADMQKQDSIYDDDIDSLLRDNDVEIDEDGDIDELLKGL